MSISEWLERCAAEYVLRAGVSKEEAFNMAIDTLSSIDDAEIISEESPEDYANGDMDLAGIA